jgi:hypothetical protein
MLEEPEIVRFLQVRPEAGHPIVERAASAAESQVAIPMKEHKPAVGRAAVHVTILAAIQ